VTGYRNIDVAPDRHALHFAAEMPAAQYHLAGHQALGENASLAVDVFEEQVERGQSLGQAALDDRPFGGRDDARDQIVRKDALGALFLPVDGEGDALVEKREVGRRLALPELGGIER
jgi:hypothetical protein